MEQRRVTPLTTAGCFAAMMLVFALLSTYVPIFSFIGYFIMPIPMVIIFMKYGLRQALLLGVTVGFLMGLFIDPVTALVQFLSFGAVGLTLGAGFRYEWSAVRLLGTVTAALVAVFVVMFRRRILPVHAYIWFYLLHSVGITPSPRRRLPT